MTMTKKAITYSTCIILLMLLTLGCKEKMVLITKQYVINPNWNENNNSFAIHKMKLIDSSQTIDLKDPTEPELYHKLVIDTTFSYIANIRYNGENYKKRKVYFNRYNDFLWWGDFHKSNSSKKILGELQQDTWYLMVGLSQFKTMYYIYIDLSDNIYIYIK